MDTTHPPIHKNPGRRPVALSLHPWAKLRSLFPFSFLTPLCSRCLPDLYLFQKQMSSMRPSRRGFLVLLIIHTDPKTCVYAGAGLVGDFLFWFVLYFLILLQLSVLFCCFKVSVLAQVSASKSWGERSLEALAHIRMPHLCQYLFPSWFGSISNTCFSSSGCCNHSRCCGWSSVAGFKCTVPRTSAWGFESEAVEWKTVCTELSPWWFSAALGMWVLDCVQTLIFIHPPTPLYFFLFPWWG